MVGIPLYALSLTFGVALFELLHWHRFPLQGLCVPPLPVRRPGRPGESSVCKKLPSPCPGLEIIIFSRKNPTGTWLKKRSGLFTYYLYKKWTLGRKLSKMNSKLPLSGDWIFQKSCFGRITRRNAALTERLSDKVLTQNFHDRALIP